MIRACLLPIGLATNTFRDPTDRAAAATVGAGKSIAYLADTGALRAQNFPAPRTGQEGGFVNAIGHDTGDLSQPLSCLDSFLWQDSIGCVGYVLACGPETAARSTTFAYLPSILSTADAEKIR